MVSVLWVSRHALTPPQLADLRRIYGEISVQSLDKTVSDVSDILAHPADVYAVVLPLELVAELKKQTFAEVIVPKSARIPSGRSVWNPATNRSEAEYVFQHLHWIRVRSISIDTEIL